MNRPRSIVRSAAAGLLAAAMALPAAGQDPPRFEGSVEVVAVDANVVDDRGQPVRDLTAAEFVVKVDGRTRRVLSAEFVELRARTAAGPPAPGSHPDTTAPAPVAAAAREGRRIVLVLDRGQLGGSVHLAAEAAKRFLEQLGPEDRVAVFPLPSGPRVDFTADHAAIEKVLGKIGPLSDGVFSKYNVSFTEALTYLDGRSRPETNPVGYRECAPWIAMGMSLEACLLDVATEARRQVEDHESGVRDRLNALEALCQALARIPGPKAVVLVSGGFTSAMTRRDDVSQRMGRIATAAAAARVSLYSIYFSHPVKAFDASGTREQHTPEEDRHLMAGGLGELTGLAGGAMFDVVAGANFAFDRIASETSAHYLLGLEPGKRDRDGKPHEIEVKVVRKGVEVRARRQFVMAPESAPNRVVARAAAPAVPPSPLRVATHVLRGDTVGQIKIVMAAQVDGFSDARFDIKVLDPRGTVVGTMAEHVTAVAGTPIRHQETILLPRGLYTLKAQATDAGGREALVERPLNAELFHGVGFDVSDLMLLESEDGKMRLAPMGAMTSGTMGVYLELYVQPELPTDRLGVTLEILGADRVSRSTTPLALRRNVEGLIYAEGVVDLWALPPGAYTARALVTFGAKTARRIQRVLDFNPATRPAPPAARE